ncbi:hypothetical protein, partial [Alteromonas abrolhosensis]|uniref:hypothetical protein n=1 Tax=Alteromonas abrolhosensis TaxID=1892904 RepID=UPI003BA9C975
MRQAGFFFIALGIGLAAFVIDTIASSSGVVTPPPGYLRSIAEIENDLEQKISASINQAQSSL